MSGTARGARQSGRGRSVRYARTGRIRRHGVRRLPGPTWEPDRPGRAGSRAGPPQRRDPAAGRRRRADRRRGPRHGQVIAFSYDGQLSRRALAEALSGNLPRDVAIGDLRRAPQGFQPRYAARYREYRYIDLERTPEPAPRADTLRVREPLDVAAMARAAAAFVGRHDFSAFGGSRSDNRSGPSTGRVRRNGRRGHDRRVGRRVPAPDGPTHRGRSHAVGHGEIDEAQIWSGAAPHGSRPSAERPPRRTGCASGGSSSGGDRQGHGYERGHEDQ